MIATYDHEDGDVCARQVASRLDAMVARVERARESDEPVVYVNDHYGRWDGSRERLIDWVLDQTPDRGLVEPLLPRADDHFLVKARHSIFYETPLGYLLNQEDLEGLTLLGQVTEQCVLYSALDAHVRHFDVRVAVDACAPIDDDLGNAALEMMRRNMGAELV